MQCTCDDKIEKSNGFTCRIGKSREFLPLMMSNLQSLKSWDKYMYNTNWLSPR